MKWHFFRADLIELQKSVRQFYGCLPITEVMTNFNLVKQIESFEKQLRGILNEEVTH